MSILERLPCKEDLDHLWQILPNARLVGGVVRDLLINKPVTDVDMAIPDPPEIVIKTLQAAGIKVIPTGLSHGTITALLNDRAYEITTLRKDVQTNGRHAEVVWTRDWQEDAARRDFTVNAMFCDQQGHIWDYYGGQGDLKQGKIRFVGQACQRIHEDVLRVLRFFRFYARFGTGQPDPEAIQAIGQSTQLLKKLSAERVWAELQKILIGPGAGRIIGMMDQYGVLSVLMPFGYDVPFFQKMIHLNPPEHAILRLAVLVKGNSSVIGKHLRLSRKQEKELRDLHQMLPLSIDMSEIELIKLKAQYDLDLLLGRSWIQQTLDHVERQSLWQNWRNRLIKLPQPIFPLTGKDLIQIGVKSGPDMGNVLQEVRNWWLSEGCKPDKTCCLEWLKSNMSERIT
ncbi:CCA tRNA nucleotidyltransferase [Commensalibacter oyaizuii]|uniref:CCA tRNA nucleotidyltransferase n=1 Tax=Commensalibacter oyaizuii TaxID=3043873 RepID=A0ABT6Q0K8_9PROT|nr:CCA tRNA nucleotidyltransferase [Commensalibacter sp. TBRC 16381]MDI2090651.1 CCA tRNA nucleotidyltransferase [Commensalibacter sp. TBRC 16381]